MAIDKAAEMAKIQALIADIPDVQAVPATEHATEEDLADVAAVLEQVKPDTPGGDEEEAPAPVAKLAAVLEEEDAIEKLLKSSQEKRGGIHEAQTKADRILKEAEEKAQSILRDAESKLTERAQSLLSRMLSDPMGAAQEFRVSPDEVIRATAESNDPAAKLLRDVRNELSKRDREVGELRTVVQKLIGEKEEETRAQQRERYNKAQEKFLADADKDTYPAINLFWGKKRFLGEAYEESQAIHEAASVLGGRPEITDKQIVARLEKRAREELKTVAKDLLALVASLEKDAAAKEKPEKGKTAKTLPPAAGSASTKTAAASPKRFKSDAEEHAYLVKVAQEILNKQTGRKPKVA